MVEQGPQPLREDRKKEEVEEYRKIDPITQVKDIIIQNNYASDVEILDMDNRVKQRVL